MELLTKYFDLQKQIYEYFGYVEDWRAIPLDDKTDAHWMLSQDATGSGWVAWSEKPLSADVVEAGEEIYSAEIYTQRFLPKWVYRADEYTMVCADTRTDGNKFLMVFANDKECSDKALKELYAECWAGVQPTPPQQPNLIHQEIRK